MNHVIRRSTLILTVLTALFLGACGSDSEVWLERGDVVVTKADVLDFAEMQSGGNTSFPRLNADAVRGLFRDLIIGDAAVQYLADRGITPTEADLDPFLSQMAANGLSDTDSPLVRAFARSEWAFSPEFGLVQPVIGVDGQPLVDAVGNPQLELSADGTAARTDIADVMLSSRVGVWDADALEVLPPLLGD